MTKSNRKQNGGTCVPCDEYKVCKKSDGEITTMITEAKKLLAAHEADPVGTKYREENIEDFEKRIFDLQCLRAKAKGIYGGLKYSKKSGRGKRSTKKMRAMSRRRRGKMYVA